MLNLRWSNSSELTAYTSYTIGTIPSGYRPKKPMCYYLITANFRGYSDVNANGTITIQPHSTFGSSKTTSYGSISSTYIVA